MDTKIKITLRPSRKKIFKKQIRQGLNADDYDLKLDKKHNYLLTESLQTRYVIAADFLKNCDHIVEIGCFQTPIYNFLTHTPKSVTVIDPFTQNFSSSTLRGQACEIKHIKGLFQDINLNLKEGSYGLVVLGLDLESSKEAEFEVLTALANLINNARKTVLEFTPHFKTSRNQVEKLSDMISVRETRSFDLDLRHDRNAVFHNPLMNKGYLYRSLRFYKRNAQ